MAILSTIAELCSLFSPAVLGKVSRHHTNESVSPLGSLLEVTIHCQCHWTTLSHVSPSCAAIEVLQAFTQFCEVCCRSEAFLYIKTFIPHWQNNDEQGVEEGHCDCFPAFCSILCNACPLMKKLFISSESSSCSRSSSVTKVTTVRRLHTQKFLCKSFQTIAPSPMILSPHRVMSHQHEVCSSGVSARWHHTLFRFPWLSATFNS